MGGGAGAGARRRLVSARKIERLRCPLSLDLPSTSIERSPRLGETGGSRPAARLRQEGASTRQLQVAPKPSLARLDAADSA